MKTAEELVAFCPMGWFVSQDKRCESDEELIQYVKSIQRDALVSAAALCDKHEDECTHERTCHAHDSVEILALMPEVSE